MLRIGKGLLATALAASAIAALAGCGGDSPAPAAAGGQTAAGQSTASVVPGCSTAPPPTAANPKRYDAPPPMTIDPAKTYTATMETSCGRIVIALDPRSAPKTVNSFVFLAHQGFYDGLTFHRVVRDFVIQGGDPTGTGSGDAGYEFEDELPTDGYEVGSLAMANSGPNTNGSQFFIVTGTAGTNLPNSYSRFGKVTSGMQAAKRIESLASPDAPQDDPAAQTPRQTAWIYSVTIAEK